MERTLIEKRMRLYWHIPKDIILVCADFASQKILTEQKIKMHFAAEALKVYGRYFFEHYNKSKLFAIIRTENVASCKSAEQAGFRLTESKMYQDIYDAQPKQYNFYEMTAPVKG